jgi:hypothetical protein
MVAFSEMISRTKGVTQALAATIEGLADRLYRKRVPCVFSALRDAFREGLRELGYVEGKNIIIEYRDGEGRVERLAGLAADLVRQMILILDFRLEEGRKQPDSVSDIV